MRKLILLLSAACYATPIPSCCVSLTDSAWSVLGGSAASVEALQSPGCRVGYVCAFSTVPVLWTDQRDGTNAVQPIHPTHPIHPEHPTHPDPQATPEPPQWLMAATGVGALLVVSGRRRA